MLYRILKIIIGIGIRFYYKEIKVKNKQFLEHNGPMIIIANHPNSMMDGWIIAQACSQPIHFLAKGTFFNSPLKRKFLNSLNMIPINRKVDQLTNGVNNEDSFDACYKVLEAGKTLVIFPEGNSILERQLRELRTGTARIALEAENRNGDKLNLKIVPLGLFYSKAEKFRSSVMVNIEQGLFAADYLNDYKVNHSIAAKKLTEKFRIHLERVLLTTESSEQEKLIDAIFEIIRDVKQTKNVEENTQLLQRIKDKLEEIQLIQPYLVEEIQNLVKAIHWQSEKLEIKTEFLSKRFKSKRFLTQLFFSSFITLLGLPLFVFGLIQSIIPYQLTSFLMPKLVKNVEYYAPIAILLGLVFYPLNYVAFLHFIGDYFEFNIFLKIAYFIAMPLTGMLAFQFVQYLKSTSFKWKYFFQIANQNEALKELRKHQFDLKKIMLP
jgi:1-acyl-sn-glycerol-3-phosphate acyltransferase